MPNFASKSFYYLDYNATSPLSDKVVQNWNQALDLWGNASSIHWAGRKSKLLLRETRQKLAEILEISPLELIFNSGGSEGNNTVIKTFSDLVSASSIRKEFITSTVEHPSVRKCFEALQEQGHVVHWISVDKNGNFDFAGFKKVLSEKTLLVSVMLANNETGTIFPIAEIAKLAHANGAYVHADCVQGLGKIKLSLKDLDVDYATFSAHKIGGVKGLGFLYQKKGTPLKNLILGGAQERQRRGGTENNLGIWALSQCLDQLRNIEHTYLDIKAKRDHLEDLIKQQISGCVFNCSTGERLPNTSSMIISGVDGETLLMSLDLKGYAVSTGAACSSGNPEPSPVLLAMGFSRAEAQSSLRVSIGFNTTDEVILHFVETLKEVVTRIRSINSQDNQVLSS
jgi:cysteine desulfurase